MTKNEKISLGVKRYFANGGYHALRGKRGQERSEADKQSTSDGLKKWWDERGRLTDEQKRARNLAKVRAYQARKLGAIDVTSDLALIRSIYEHCPVGYSVDHIIALAVGGKHHQDNLQYLPRNENSRKGIGQKFDEKLVIRWQDQMGS